MCMHPSHSCLENDVIRPCQRSAMACEWPQQLSFQILRIRTPQHFLLRQSKMFNPFQARCFFSLTILFFCFWSSLLVFFSRFHRSFHGFEVVLLEELKAAPQPEAKRRRFKQALRCPKLQSAGPKLCLLFEVELFSSLYWQRDMRL